MWIAVLSGCKKHGQHELAQNVFDQYTERLKGDKRFKEQSLVAVKGIMSSIYQFDKQVVEAIQEDVVQLKT